MKAKEGKEETEALVRMTCTALGWHAKTIIPADNESVVQTTWLYGLMPEPSFAASTPLGLGVLKFLAMGKCKVFVFHLSSLMDFMQNKGGELSDENLDNVILNLKDADLQALVVAKVSFYHGTLTSGQGVYVPCGYLRLLPCRAQ